MIRELHIILYVASQQVARDFYRDLLQAPPVFDVPGMTEFALPGCKLGLMPETGIRRLLPSLPEPVSGIPRCELYLRVEDPEGWLARAVRRGARKLAPVARRDWGEDVGYVTDPDGHVLAFARV